MYFSNQKYYRTQTPHNYCPTVPTPSQPLASDRVPRRFNWRLSIGSWELVTVDPSIVIISERRTARGCSQQGVRFDPDMPQTIRLEFAKSNTKVSKPKPAVATAAPAAHPALMHPLTGRKYRRTHTPPGARSTAPIPVPFQHFNKFALPVSV